MAISQQIMPISEEVRMVQEMEEEVNSSIMEEEVVKIMEEDIMVEVEEETRLFVKSVVVLVML